MSLLRSSTQALRTASACSSLARPAAMNSARGYAGKPPEGEFAESYQRGSPSGFSKKEQAQEGAYVQREEAAKLKAREWCRRRGERMD